MPRLPDQFDLWVQRARETVDPARQADLVMGALVGLREWHFLNLGTRDQPQSAEAEIEDLRCLLLFSESDRIREMMEQNGTPPGTAPPVISIPTTAAMPWCLARRAEGCDGLLVNPMGEAFLLPMDQLEAFYKEWIGRGGREASGFWIPNMTSEEEDFWQEHGL